MGAEVVGLDDAAPMEINTPRPIFARADPILPVIVVGKAPAGPAKNRRPQRLESFDNLGAGAFVGEPQTVVDTSPSAR